MERVTILLFLSCSLVACIHAGALTSCARNYEKHGCFVDTSDQSASMLVYDRYNIQWKNIEAYMHSLACRCEAKARKNKKYAGFAIHFWGECYGKTQAQIDALGGKSPSKECTGDQTYKGCSAEANECAGHAYTDFVYTLKVATVENICEDMGGNISCTGDRKIKISKLSFGPRTESICGSPITNNWDEKCTNLDFSGASYFKRECNGKSSCVIEGWKEGGVGDCSKMLKYIQVQYSCNA